MGPAHFRVFLSSPGDVHDERTLARRVIESLPKQPFIRNRATIEVVSWDDPEALSPVYANLTPQQALQRHLKMPSACDIVVVVLWSRLGTPLPDDAFYRKPDGGRYLSGTEWEFEDAARTARPVLVYRRSETPVMAVDDPEWAAKATQYALVKQFFQRFTNVDGSLNGLYRVYEKPSDFEQLLDTDVRAVLETLLTTRPTEPDPAPPDARSSEPEPTPYPGLRRLSEQDAGVFFGRGAEVDALIKIIAGGRRFIAVVGASGSGKSSLVRAGLMPRLRGNAVSGSKDWKYATCAPADLGDNPFLALAAAMSPLAVSGRPPIQLANEMAADPNAAARFCDAVLSGSPEWARVALVIDQLEELFTISTPGHRDGFVRTIDALAAHPRVVVVGTLRTDFVGEATNSARLVDLLRNGNYLLMPPGMKALSDIIALPATRANLTIEPGLLERIIDEVGPQPGTLPLLAYTLEQLYNAGRRTRSLNLADYESLGGIRGAITKRADESLRLLEPAAIASLPGLFRQLLTMNAAGIVTRRRARQRDVLTSPTTVTLVRTLVDARLLIADSRDGENTIEVAHEALFEGWDQMRSWIAENREYLLWRNRLRVRLDDWMASGRDESGALRGVALQEALKWLERQSDDLSEEERTFIRWPLSDEFQVRGVIRSAREVLVSSPDRVARDGQRGWLTALILAGEAGEIESLLRTQAISENVLIDARVAAVSVLARAGELNCALAIAGEMTGTGRAQAASDLAEIAAASGRREMAATAATLIGDTELTRRARARAMTGGASGSYRQLTVESLSHILSSQSVIAPSADAAPGNLDWAATLTGASDMPSSIMRVAMLTSGMRSSDEANRPVIVNAFLREVATCFDGWDEPFWQGLVAVRSADALSAIGACSEAEELATRIRSPRQRAHARAVLARHRLARQDFAEAVALCSLALDDMSTSGLLAPGLERVIDVAGLLGTSGRPDDGRRLAQRALGIAEETAAASTAVVVRVAQAVALCGAVDEAAQLLGREALAIGRAAAFRSVARALAGQGHLDRVMALAQHRRSPLEQADVLACIGESGGSGATAGEGDVVDMILRAFTGSAKRRRVYSQCLIRAASMLIRNGRVAALLDLLRAMERKHERVEASIAVMERLVAEGVTDEALKLADDSVAVIDALDDHDERATTFARLAGIIARCGRLEDAHRTARRCHLINEQLAALADILRSSIVRNQYRGAAELFRPRTASHDPPVMPTVQ